MSHTKSFILFAMFILASLAGCGSSGRATLPAAPLAHPARHEQWMFAGVRGQRLTTGHYKVFTTTDNPVLKGGIAGFMEAARANYVNLTGLAEGAGESKMTVYLLGSRSQWAELTKKVTGPAAATVLKIGAGGYCYAGICVFWDIGVKPTLATASHEGMHQFLYHATRQSLPTWAEEGLAVQAEGFKLSGGLVTFDPTANVGRLTTLRKTILAGRWRTTDEMINMDTADNINHNPFSGAEYYSQLWAMILMVREDPVYREGFRQLCRDAADGTMGRTLGFSEPAWNRLQRNRRAYEAVLSPKAFAHYIDADTDRFERRFAAYARKLARVR